MYASVPAGTTSLGRTNAADDAFVNKAIQLPRNPDTIHVIETDDPEGDV
jgi:hypothetical protein